MDTDIQAEINTVLPGSDPLDNLYVTHCGGTEYNVLSARNGNVTKYWVDTGPDPACSCGDYEYNRNDDNEICAHLAAAVLADRMSPEELAVSELISVTGTISQSIRDAERAAEQARDATDEIEGALVETRDAQAGGNVEDPDRNGHTGGSTGGETDIEEKAETLQNAFDSVIDGMEVEYNGGVIWVNITPNAPEELPGPGSVSTFNALLRDPEQTQYAPDDQSAPGEYFKNRIDPDDVEEYISEVLE